MNLPAINLTKWQRAAIIIASIISFRFALARDADCPSYYSEAWPGGFHLYTFIWALGLLLVGLSPNKKQPKDE